MKILLDGRLLSDKPTGISRYSRELIKIYQAYYGYENVEVIINEDLKEKSFKYIKTELKPFNLIHFFKFHKFLKGINANIYHSLYYSNSFFKDKTKIYITTVHDLMYKLVPEFFSKNKLKNLLAIKYYDFIVKKTLNNSEYIISVSNTTKNDVQKIFNKKSIFVPEGINELKEKEKEISVLLNKKYLLYIGNSRPHKNLDFLCQTFEELETDKFLVLIGTKKDYTNLEKKILSLGFLEDCEIKWAYINAECFIFPSLYEGFGLPILEALDNGCKVISSNAGALKEFAIDSIQYFNSQNKQELKNCILNIDNQSFDKNEVKKLLSFYNWKNTETFMKKIFLEIEREDI